MSKNLPLALRWSDLEPFSVQNLSLSYFSSVRVSDYSHFIFHLFFFLPRSRRKCSGPQNCYFHPILVFFRSAWKLNLDCLRTRTRKREQSTKNKERQGIKKRKTRTKKEEKRQELSHFIRELILEKDSTFFGTGTPTRDPTFFFGKLMPKKDESDSKFGYANRKWMNTPPSKGIQFFWGARKGGLFLLRTKA